MSGSVSRPALLALSVLQSCSHPQHPALILTREGGTSRAGCGTQHPRGDRGRERCARAPCGVASGAGQQPDSIPATRFRLQGHRTCAGSGTEFSAQSRTFTINSDFGILLRTEVQPQVDRAAVRFLQHSVPDPLGTGNVDSIGQNLVTERRPKTSRSLSAYRTATGRTRSPCPMGASSSWRGCWPSWTTEAQLATVPGREIAHVVESHTLEAIRRSWNDQERDKLVGAAAGAALGGILGGILGGKKGGAEAVVGAATAGAIAAAAMAGAVNGFLRGKDSRRQETEADLA